MENEPPTVAAQDEGKVSKRGRIMGKLFGRDRRGTNEISPTTTTNTDRDLNAFFNGPSDNLVAAHPAPSQGPPVLAKLDIGSATRYPNALQVTDTNQYAQSTPRRSLDPQRRNKKGLVVRFVDTYPEIIGEGGDEAATPTLEISKRRRSRPSQTPPRPPDAFDLPLRPSQDAQKGNNLPQEPLQRTQTGRMRGPEAAPTEIPAGRSTSARYLDSAVVSNDEKRRSFIEIHQAEMREAEGLAFANAIRSASSSSPPTWDERLPDKQGAEAPVQAVPNSGVDAPRLVLPENEGVQGRPSHYEPNPTIMPLASPSHHYSHHPGKRDSRLSEVSDDREHSSLRSSLTLHEGAYQAAEDALAVFVARTRHLFELFRLQSETVRPLISSTPEDLIRAGLWWFLKGRLLIDFAMKQRPTSPQAQQQNEFAVQQACADLAKGYWLAEDIFMETLHNRRSVMSLETDDARKGLLFNLRKLALSIERKGFMPPEEAYLPQTIDKSIWVEYPRLSQDLVALLCGSRSPALDEMQSSGLSILETLPPGDSASCFCFGRFPVDVFLMEKGRESERLYFPCILSIVRPHKQPNLIYVIASQNGMVQLCIQKGRGSGVSWENLNWQSDVSTVEIHMPRGFLVAVQCSPEDYGLLWSMYDFTAKVQVTLEPRPDEMCIFRSTLKNFQYLDNDPQSRQFPKEPIADCDVGLFERSLPKSGPNVRFSHGGYRIAIVTGPMTKTLRGVNQAYLPQVPIQFGFLRGEHSGYPALSIKFENGKQKGRMILSFESEKERIWMHSLLIAAAVQSGEQIYCKVPLPHVWFAEKYGDSASFKHLSALPWERATVINDNGGGSDRTPCVHAEKLRVVFDFKDGTVTDRINVGPGEFKMRLDTQNPTCLMVCRQAQADLTVAIKETKDSLRDLPANLARELDLLQQTTTFRTYQFPSMAELHAFQAAVTGFQVLFDGVASAFAISRRRMVVPIHKKWEAGATRLQVVQQPDGHVTQLLVFFDDFAHGKCMSFALKGTDVYEAFNKNGKLGVKFDDAKFPLPKTADDGADGSTQAAAETSFVCLDLPELPGEHDDIVITFESEADRDRLVECLPAPVKTSRSSRK